MVDNISVSPTDNDGINESNSTPMAELYYAADLQLSIPLESAQRLLQEF